MLHSIVRIIPSLWYSVGTGIRYYEFCAQSARLWEVVFVYLSVSLSLSLSLSVLIHWSWYWMCKLNLWERFNFGIYDYTVIPALQTSNIRIGWKIPPPQCHHMSFCWIRGPPSWAWQKCNRLLRLGRPWGAVTLSRWCVRGDRGGCSARRDLKPKFY